ncbi:MAG: hypothetical protein ABSD92_04645 [Candidatus Bathyarchaeia archaeon]|jgi:hypothetical protein
MSEEKNGKVKVTIEVEINEALMNASKEWMPRMGWMGPWRGMGPWKTHGMMSGQMPWGIDHGMRCPECGETMIKPSKEEVLEMLERKKKRLEEAIDHINKETERLKENKPEEKP